MSSQSCGAGGSVRLLVAKAFADSARLCSRTGSCSLATGLHVAVCVIPRLSIGRRLTTISGDAGTLTLLFTDIQGSTQMLHRLGDRYADVPGEHDRVMREAIAVAGGREVRTAGDSFFAVFSQPEGAVDCALRVQLGLRGAEWPGGEAPRVRMGIHTGFPEVRDGEFVGMDVHRAARVMAVAHGGQVLVTDETRTSIDAGVEVRDLGYHRLKDLREPEHLFQVLASGLESGFPELRSLNRSNLPVPASPLVGRRTETEQALELLYRPETHLLTLHGVGGAGKTRLAVEVAGEAVTRYRDGVWIALLAPIGDRSLMVSEIAGVLGVDPVADEPLGTPLVDTLRPRAVARPRQLRAPCRCGGDRCPVARRGAEARRADDQQGSAAD